MAPRRAAVVAWAGLPGGPVKRARLARKAPLKRRKPIAKQRGTARRSSREHNRRYLEQVRYLQCAAAGFGFYPCNGRIEADHQGTRGLGQKASDYTAVPMCVRHHRQRTDYTGAFVGWTAKAMRAWCDDRIWETQGYLGYPLIWGAAHPGKAVAG